MSSRREITIGSDKVWLSAITGAVAGEKKWSESRTSGTASPTYGHTHITTRVNTRHEFWLVAPDGEEKCVQLGDSQISVRENQVLTAVWGALNKHNNGPFLLLRNHNAQADNWLIKDDTTLLKRMGFSDPMLLWAFAGFAAGLLSFVVVRGPAALLVLLLCAAGGIFYGVSQRRNKVSAVKEAAAEVVKLEIGRTGAVDPGLESGGPLLPA